MPTDTENVYDGVTIATMLVVFFIDLIITYILWRKRKGYMKAFQWSAVAVGILLFIIIQQFPSPSAFDPVTAGGVFFRFSEGIIAGLLAGPFWYLILRMFLS